MQKWEYMCTAHPAFGIQPTESEKGVQEGPTIDILNVFGEHGWELINVVRDENDWLTYFLKRPKP